LELEVNDFTDEMKPTYTSEEQSTREQILRAATREFGTHGFRGASIRGIANAAGVSAGLVQHHFGTKNSLRKACDMRVMDLLRSTQYALLQRGNPLVDDELADKLDEIQPLLDYLIISLSGDSDTFAYWFREIMEYTHESLVSGRIGPALDPERDDTWMIAAVQAAMALGTTWIRVPPTIKVNYTGTLPAGARPEQVVSFIDNMPGVRNVDWTR
jgi:AcrR family transcriptional regulator